MAPLTSGFFQMGGRYDTTGVTPGKKKWRILTSVAGGLHEVKGVETKMALLDTLWFARMECRILAQLVNKYKENSERTGEDDSAPFKSTYWYNKALKVAKERQNYEKKL